MDSSPSPSPSAAPSATPGLPPIIPSPATQSVLYDGGIVSVLEINLVVGLVAFLLLAYLRWRSQRKLYFKYYGGEYQRFWENERFAGSESFSSFPAIDEEGEAEVEALVESEGEEPEEAMARAADQVKKRELTELSKNGPERFMGWVWPLVRMSKLEVAEKCGNDAMIYIHFQRCMLAFLAICVVLGIAILLPVNVTASQREDKVRSGFLSTTIGNINDSTDKSRYWAHSFVCVIISCLVYGLVWHLRKYLIACKDKFFTRSVKSAVSAHTIMIRNFPAGIVSEAGIAKHFEELIETNVDLQRSVERVRAKRRRRRTLSLDSSRRHAAAAAAASAWARGDEFNDGEQDPQSADATATADGESSDASSHNSRPKGRVSFYRFAAGQGDEDRSLLDADGGSEAGEGRAEVSGGQAEEQGATKLGWWARHMERRKRRAEEALARAREVSESESEPEHDKKKPSVVSVHVAWEVRDVLGALETYKDIDDQLDHYRQERMLRGQRPLVWFPPSSTLTEKLIYLVLHFGTIVEGIVYGGVRGRLDAIRELKRKKAEQKKEVARTKQRARAARATGIVFVTFSSSVVAKVVTNIYRKHTRLWNLNRWLADDLTPQSKALSDRQWIVSMAPEPEDIIWPNLGIGKWEKRLRVVYVNLTLLFFFSFFTTPLSIISALQPLKQAPLFADIINSLHAWNNGAILFAYLPTLFLLAVTTILPLVIWFSSMFEGHHTVSSTHKYLVVKTYVFLLFSVLLLPSLFLTSLDALIRKGWDNRQHLNVLFSGLFLPNSAAFFINYIIQMAIVGQIVEVMRLPERLQSLLLKWKAVTISQKKRADEYAYPHEYGMQYAYMMVFFATILTFSTIAPLILPFGTLYFMCKHFLDTYLLVHVRPREFDSDGSMLWIVLRVMLFTAVLFQSLMFIFLSLHGTAGQMTFVGVVLALALAAFFAAYMSGVDIFHFDKGPKPNTLPKEANWMRVFRTAYQHPCWRQGHHHHLQHTHMHRHPTLRASGAVAGSGVQAHP